MLGAIIGDIAGSVYERRNHKGTDCKLFAPGSSFTDDTVMTMATADVLMHGGDYTQTYQRYGRRFPNAGYGGSFIRWIFGEHPEPYGSWGNGSAMRVSPIGLTCSTLECVQKEALKSACVSHDHPEGIKGAQAVASAVFLARQGESKASIRSFISANFSYDLERSLDEIRPEYSFDVSCQGSVPEALIAFIESENFEDAIRKAISLGGDSDTIACITGAVAHAFYKELPRHHVEMARLILAPDLMEVTDEFSKNLPFPTRLL